MTDAWRCWQVQQACRSSAGEFGQLCYPAVDVVALSSERVDAGPSTPGVPGLDIAEVGPPGMTPESDEEGGR